MGWGRKRSGTATPRTSELERLAAQAESMVMAMEPATRTRVLAALGEMVAAGRALKDLPEPLVEVVGRMVFKFLLSIYTPTLPGLSKPDPGRMVLQVVAGAPTLLGPHREAIERMVRDAGDSAAAG